jgi:hypothetical protein
MDGTQYRAALLKLMQETITDQARDGNGTYLAVRPQTILRSYTPGMRYQADCSDYCRDLCCIAGVPDDPAGNGYQDYGNSSSIWLHLHHVTLPQAQVGDIVTFGKWSGEEHACMVMDLTDPLNPDVANMGEQGQPVKSTYQIELANHPGSVATVCKLNLPPDPPPTPQEILQAKTGFYSWLAWGLGEGPWKHYGKSNRSVRPAVPLRIPASWWARRVQFLANRKKSLSA